MRPCQLQSLVAIVLLLGPSTAQHVSELDGVIALDDVRQETDLIFVHGYGGSQCSWSLINDEVKLFSSPSYWELVGFGKHQPPKGFDFSIESQAEQIADRFKVGGYEGATVVAHSMGAAVLLVAMLEHNIKPSRIVLVDPLAYTQTLPFFIRGQLIPILSGILSRLMPPSFQVDLVLNAVYASRSNINTQIRACYIDEFRTPYHRAALINTARMLSEFDAEPFVSRFDEIKTEVHIIWGNDDPLISSDLMLRLKEDLRAVSTHLVTQCGHAPHEECPDKFIRVLRGIIDSP